MIVVLIALLVNALAAPAGNDPTVSILRYRNDQDLESIQRAIIAQYEGQLGGTTQVHAPQRANVINPYTLAVNF
ncbi:CG34305 [Drosophila busckii]|uniref:CG34305 n=1 Tax=Drosophila busckii TaxID=30019 RepID=A0A0M4F2V3_DROBS|nr:CG34305 [Drosophila busckii]